MMDVEPLWPFIAAPGANETDVLFVTPTDVHFIPREQSPNEEMKASSGHCEQSSDSIDSNASSTHARGALGKTSGRKPSVPGSSKRKKQ